MVCNYDNSPNRDQHSLSQVVLGGCGGKRWYVVRTKPGYGVAWRATPGEVEKLHRQAPLIDAGRALKLSARACTT